MKKIFIGIDFSKEKFDATLIKAEGLKECAPSVYEVFDNKRCQGRCQGTGQRHERSMMSEG